MQDKDIPGVTYIDTAEDLRALVVDSVNNDDGTRLTSAQVQALPTFYCFA